MGKALQTRDVVALVDRWNAIPDGREHMGDRAEIVCRLVNTGDEWVTAYNVVRFSGYLAGLASVHVFVRLLQSETERRESD